MYLKELVVYVDSMAECESRIRLAAALAHRHDAHLVGTYVAPNRLGHTPADAFAIGRGLTEMIAYFREVEAERCAEAHQCFVKITREHGVAAEWRIVPENSENEEKILSARYADLTIVGQRDEEGGRSEWLSLLLNSGSATLVIPQSWTAETFGTRVAVAWNASREARRAAIDALPFLKAAEATTLVVVDPRKGVSGHGDEPGADLARYLARHGIRTEVVQLASKGADVGDVILAQAAERDADLIVMGAYGHSRFTEFVLGGTTRTMLKRLRVPLLMAN